MSVAEVVGTINPALPRYEIVGAVDAPVIVALGGISAHCRTCEWWPGIAGDGKALDTRHYRVLGCDFLDHAGITTRDQADAIAAVLDDLDIARAHAFVGASYGGMVALAFAERYPERVERLIVIGAADRAHPMITAQRVVQRRIIELGIHTGRAHEAVALARALAITTYRSAREFDERFATVDAVESYLLHNGRKFADRFSPQRYLALSLSSDTHRVDPNRVTTPTTLVAAEGDTVVPREQLERLVAALAGPSRIVDLPSKNGHDAFLTEQDTLGRILHTEINSRPLTSFGVTS
jgi:homoserine O-acetyltransferase